MAIIFMDSMAHYTSHAELVTKWAGGDVNTVVAGTGAFGAPGTRAQGGLGAQVNFASLTTIELSMYWLPEAFSGAFAWFSTTLGVQCALWIYSDGTFKLLSGSSAGGTVLASSAAASVAFNEQHHIYVKIVFSQTVGTVDIKIDGVSVLSASGLDNCAQVAADCTMLTLLGDGSSNRSYSIFSHVAIANASGDITGQPRIEALFPDGAGNYSAWTPTGSGTNYQNVDETTPNDADYNASATVTNRDSYTYSNMLGSAASILAVALVPRVTKDDATARTIKRFVRIAGTDYDGAAVAVPATPGYLQEILALNPATTAAWTPSEINAIECGIKVES